MNIFGLLFAAVVLGDPAGVVNQRVKLVEIQAPETVRRGDDLCFGVRLMDGNYSRVRAALPIDVRVFDAAGRELKVRGSQLTQRHNGASTFHVQTAKDDPAGEYRISAREFSAGHSGTARVFARAAEGQWDLFHRGRNVVERGEEGAVLEYVASNRVSGTVETVKVPVESRLSPGEKVVEVEVHGERLRVGYRVGPRRADPGLKVVLTGFRHGFEDRIAEFGFSHVFNYSFGGNDMAKFAENVPPSIVRLDNVLAHGFGFLAEINELLAPGMKREDYARRYRTEKVPRGGKFDWKHLPIEVSDPEVLKMGREWAARYVEAYGSHPAFRGVRPCGELRDGSFPSFRSEHLRYKAETGHEVPDVCQLNRILHYELGREKARLPDGIVPVDDPVVSYYRWFWKGGDGWPQYVSGIAGEFKKGLGGKCYSQWEPIVRCPPIWNPCRNFDCVGTWVYVDRDPVQLAAVEEEVEAMAEGIPGAGRSIAPQIICYRSSAAPKGVPVENPPEWTKRYVDCDFPCVPPDCFAEGVWNGLAKPIEMMKFHGWGCFFDDSRTNFYSFTCPEFPARLRELIRGTIRPLGPTLVKLGRPQPRFAVYESFANAVLGGPHGMGWQCDPVAAAIHGRLNPRVVYDEHVLRGDLAGVDVVYASQCDFISADVAEKLREFRRRGGVIVGDGHFPKSVGIDIEVEELAFVPPPKSDHAGDVEASAGPRREAAVKFIGATVGRLSRVGEELHAKLAGRYSAPAESSRGDLLVYPRLWRDVPYLVTVNDRRDYGDYMGQWGYVKERGVYNRGQVVMRGAAAKTKAVYELSRGGEVPFAVKGGDVELDVEFHTSDGRLFAFLPAKIASVAVEAPAKVVRGNPFDVVMKVLDEAGRPVHAALPVEIRLYDAKGREVDGLGFACAEDGIARLTALTSLDDAEGAYTLVCRDRATGLAATTRIDGVQ